MTEDFADPSTIDVDEVIANINHQYETRGRDWTSDGVWPNVTVLALAREIMRLRAYALRDTSDEDEGCWMAYHGDFSGVAIFPAEIDALRHAVANAMSVQHVTWGDLREQVR